MGSVLPELKYSGPLLGVGRIFPLLLKETRNKLLLGLARVRLSECPRSQLVDVSQTLEVVTLSCGLQALAEWRNA